MEDIQAVESVPIPGEASENSSAKCNSGVAQGKCQKDQRTSQERIFVSCPVLS